MATKDYKVTITNEQDEYSFSAKKKNAIYIKGIDQSDIDASSFRIDANNLLFSAKGKDFIVSDYTGIKYIKTDNALGKTDLLDIISHSYVDNTNEIKSYNSKKLTVTGTNYNDVIDLSESGYVPTGKTNIKKNKGLTINGGNGDDEITGTDYNDIIKGGNGNDTIEGGVGADTITGGAGITTVNYTKGHGNDIINLTKGEEFIFVIDGVANITDLKFEYANKNKDLRIYTDDDEFITIKNFAAKDVTNNANAKKEIIDESSVGLVVGGKIYDLRTSRNITDNEDVVLYKTTLGENAKNFTGTWLNDDINAKDVLLYKKVKQGKKKVTVEKELKDTGLTLKGGAGNDTITGTKYSDKIYGNTGSDTINAGTGNNYIYFNKGDGHDIIENGNGIDTLVFAKKTTLSYSFDKYDLIVKYSDKDTVTLKDYFKGHSVQYVQIGTKKTAFNPPRPQIKESNKDGYHIFQGTDIDDTINGTVGNDKIYSNGGIDTINGKKGNDIIYCSDEEQTLEFETGSDNDTVNLGNGTQAVKLLYDDSDGVTDCTYTKEDNDLVIIKTKTYNATEIETTVYRDNNGNLTLSPTTIVQNKSVVVYRDNNGDLTSNSTHVENNTKVSGTFYKDHNGNITKDHSTTITKTIQNEYKYTGDYSVSWYKQYDEYGNITVEIIEILPYKYFYNNETEVATLSILPFYGDVYWDGKNYTLSKSYTETITVENTLYKGNVYRDYSGNYTTSSCSNVPNTKLTGYYKDYYGNYTKQSTTILDNEVVEGAYYIDLDGNIVSEKHKTTDTITIKDYFSSDFDKTNIQFNDSENVNLSEYIDDKLNETCTLIDNGENTDITSNGGVDTLIFPENMDLTYEHNLTNDDLVIRYGNSSVTLKEYFILDHSVKKVGNLILSELIDENINEIYTLTDTGKNTEIISNGGTDTLIFPEDDDLIYEHYLVNDDLIIRYGNSSVTLKDYFIKDIYSVTAIIHGNNELFVSDEVEGNIRIIGTGGNDTIEGTTGHNIINAGEGSNIIKITSGNDEIVNGGGTDELQFNQTVNLRYYKEINSNDLIIKYNESDYVKLKDYFVNNTHSVKSILNGDENLNLLNELTTKGIKIIGSNNSDNIIGTIYDDTIESKQGIDVINGKQGNNVYKFYVNDGQNTIINDFGNDTIELPDNTDIEYHKEIDNSDLIIYYGNNDSIRLQNYFEENSHSVKTIKIGDTSDNLETVLNNSNIYIDGTEEDDTITGTIYSDFINGGSGNNTYIFNTGDGQDTIKNDTGYDTIKFEEEKVLQYHRQIGNNDLRITYGNSDSILLENYFVNNTHSVKNIINGDNELVLNNVVEQQLIITGTDNNDIINGTTGNNYIYGKDGDDEISAGKGKDTINGGSGNNTYTFNTDDGQDTIKNGLGNDTVKFEEEQSLKYHKQIGNNDLKITYGNSDSILLENYFVNNTHSVKNINHLNTIKSLESEINKGLIITDTNHNDTIEGTIGNDTYIVTGGNDIILNGDGIDTISFTNTVILSYHKQLGSNDLTIKYNNSDSIILKDYFINNSHSVKNIKNGNNVLVLDDEVENGLIITDTTNNDEVTGTSGNNTYILTGGNDTITNVSGNDTIKFAEELDIKYEKSDNSNDLYLYHGTDKITLNNYFENYSHSVKTILNGTKEINLQDDIETKGLTIVVSLTNLTGTKYADKIGIRSYNTINSIVELEGNNVIENDGVINKQVYGGEDDDTITNNGRIGDGTGAGNIYGGSGNDSLTNNGTVQNSIYGEDGEDIIVNNGIVYNSSVSNYSAGIYGGNGGDNITNNIQGTANGIWGGEGNDTITNYGIVNYRIDGGNGNNIILNEVDAVVKSAIICGNGKDIITNKGKVFSQGKYGTYSGTIEGGDGNDTITNDTGAEVLNIYGGNGDDTIINNGIVHDRSSSNSNVYDGGIYGEEGDDTITNNQGASTYVLDAGNGNDIITNYGSVGSGQVGYLSTGSGDDQITNYGGITTLNTISGYNIVLNKEDAYIRTINGGSGIDVITNNGRIGETGNIGNGGINGGDDNDIITNNSHCRSISGGNGDDNITNYGIMEFGISGENGNDIITNYGTIYSINGGAGDDIITNSGIISNVIEGSSGNDTYNIDINHTVKISDFAGENDSLNIINGNKDNLRILFNVDLNGNVDSNGLRIISKSDVNTWISDSSTSIGISVVKITYGNGSSNYNNIETINSLDGYSITSSDINNLKGLVASWLTSGGRNYSNVNSVLSSGNENDISALMTYFTDNTNWQQVQP